VKETDGPRCLAHDATNQWRAPRSPPRQRREVWARLCATSILPETTRALRDAIARFGQSAHSDAALDAVLDRVCRESHAAGMRPEHLVVELREAWAAPRTPLEASDARDVQFVPALARTSQSDARFGVGWCMFRASIRAKIIATL
jgi:hypothetical protein